MMQAVWPRGDKGLSWIWFYLLIAEASEQRSRVRFPSAPPIFIQALSLFFHLELGPIFRHLNKTCLCNSNRILRVGASAKGVHPFSFRTRKLSLSAPMVLRKWESRSAPTRMI